MIEILGGVNERLDLKSKGNILKSILGQQCSSLTVAMLAGMGLVMCGLN